MRVANLAADRTLAWMLRYTPILFFLHLFVTIMAGCAAPPAESMDPLGGAPEDFSLHVLIKTGRDVQPQSKAHLEPSEYILFADGSLHYAEFDEDGSPSDPSDGHFPRLRQVLDRAAVSEIWSVAQQAGFTDPANAQPPMNFDLIEINRDERAHLIDFRGGGERWVFIRKTPGNESPEPGITRLVRTMAKYAWASDLPEEDIYVHPPRYDFGPDPYARYRR